ncbi:MAG: hypothetical protein ACSW8C_05115 [bacterium]
MKRRTLSLLIFAIYGNVLYAHLSGLYFGEEFYSMLKLHVTTWYHGLLLYDTDPSFNPISISMSENNFGELSEAEKERETIRFISWFLQNKPTIVYKKNDFRKIAKILNEYFEEIIQKNKNYCNMNKNR